MRFYAQPSISLRLLLLSLVRIHQRIVCDPTTPAKEPTPPPQFSSVLRSNRPPNPQASAPISTPPLPGHYSST
ncbi:hypothetical protein BDZ97DRAFT_1846723 [Flammula alnicola]|nr:hypothetical protein BDZ97DRAFT_1846723 [Flammula alnicola]